MESTPLYTHMQRKVKDLTDQQFGKYTVIERVPTRYGHVAFWRCRCECGTLSDVPGCDLRNGRRQSCCHCNSRTQSNYHDLTGEQFGKWKVIDRIPRSEAKHNQIWQCRCECGTTRPLATRTLKQAHETHSGCRKCAAPSAYSVGLRYRPFEALYIKASRSAKRDGHSFEITYENFLAIKEDCCHYCRSLLTWAEYGTRKNGQAYNVDRMNNDQGYIVGNVVSCCKKCNHAKGNRFTYDEWYGMTAYFRNCAA